MIHDDLDDVELGLVVSLDTLRGVLKTLSVDGRRWWVASDPHDAAETGSLTIGHGDPNCKDRLNTSYFRVPVVSSAAADCHRVRLVLLFDSSCVTAEEPGFHVEEGIVMRDALDDFSAFFEPIKAGLMARLQAGV
jgi:hypothetical protein